MKQHQPKGTKAKETPKVKRYKMQKGPIAKGTQKNRRQNEINFFRQKEP